MKGDFLYLFVIVVLILNASASPSGLDMPQGDLPGWKMVISDDFAGSSIDTSKWVLYQGEAGNDSGYFAQSHVFVSNGTLVISGYKDPVYTSSVWVTGGMNADLPTVYGKYLVRMRMDQGNGISMILLLWPQDESWPPEVDFAEDNGANPRNFIDATCWYNSSGQEMSVVKELTSIDTTQWHTYGVEWTSGKLVYTIDGQPWETLTSQYVPSVPMHLCIQTQAWSCGLDWENCPDSSTPANVNMYVDWAVQYAPVPITNASNTVATSAIRTTTTAITTITLSTAITIITTLSSTISSTLGTTTSLPENVTTRIFQFPLKGNEILFWGVVSVLVMVAIPVVFAWKFPKT